MPICIEIEVADDGQVTVGVCPPKEGGEPKEYMKPAQSVDDALAQAKSMLAGQGQQPQQPQPMQQPAQGGDAANAAAAKAFEQIRGGM